MLRGPDRTPKNIVIDEEYPQHPKPKLFDMLDQDLTVPDKKLCIRNSPLNSAHSSEYQYNLGMIDSELASSPKNLTLPTFTSKFNANIISNNDHNKPNDSTLSLNNRIIKASPYLRGNSHEERIESTQIRELSRDDERSRQRDSNAQKKMLSDTELIRQKLQCFAKTGKISRLNEKFVGEMSNIPLSQQEDIESIHEENEKFSQKVVS